MKKTRIHELQLPMCGGGGTNLLPTDYEVTLLPDESRQQYGLFAHVSREVQEEIFNGGFGEHERHTANIMKKLKELGDKK